MGYVLLFLKWKKTRSDYNMAISILKELYEAFCKCKNLGYNHIPVEICNTCILQDIPVDVPHEGNSSGTCKRNVCFIVMHDGIDNLDFRLRGFIK